ncbi:MAG: hypothetical protein ACLRFI_02470, partial [Alphaproteobacteria bacterium]
MKSFTKQWFFDLDSKLRKLGLDCDDKSFDEIKQNLKHRQKLNPDDFAFACFYVVLAGGFSQKTAKKIHANICNIVKNNGANYDVLVQVFNNKNKINAICKIWNNRVDFCDSYYKLNSLDDKLK